MKYRPAQRFGGAPIKPALGGLVLAALGFYYPQILGLSGFETQEAIAGNTALNYA